jgi:hypothetical protein
VRATPTHQYRTPTPDQQVRVREAEKFMSAADVAARGNAGAAAGSSAAAAAAAAAGGGRGGLDTGVERLALAGAAAGSEPMDEATRRFRDQVLACGGAAAWRGGGWRAPCALPHGCSAPDDVRAPAPLHTPALLRGGCAACRVPSWRRCCSRAKCHPCPCTRKHTHTPTLTHTGAQGDGPGRRRPQLWLRGARGAAGAVVAQQARTRVCACACACACVCVCVCACTRARTRVWHVPRCVPGHASQPAWSLLRLKYGRLPCALALPCFMRP